MFACVSPFILPKFLVQSHVDGFSLSGESEGEFAISRDGWLYLERPLDWSRKDHYEMTVIWFDSAWELRDLQPSGADVCDCIQIEALVDGDVVDEPIHVTVSVLDINNNAPHFNQSVYTAWVREKTPAGTFDGSRAAKTFKWNPTPARVSVMFCVSFQVHHLPACLPRTGMTPRPPTLSCTTPWSARSPTKTTSPSSRSTIRLGRSPPRSKVNLPPTHRQEPGRWCSAHRGEVSNLSVAACNLAV